MGNLFLGLYIPSDEPGGRAREEPVALVTRPGNVVNIPVVGEQLQQLLGVDPVVGGQGRCPHVPQRHHAVIGPAK